MVNDNVVPMPSQDGGSRIIRGPRVNSNFYILENRIARDSNLSWEARGVLIYLLTHPDNWQVSLKHLVNQGDAGRHKMRRILNELEETGYLKRTPIRDEAGRFVGYESVVTETPITGGDYRTSDNPTSDNSLQRRTDS